MSPSATRIADIISLNDDVSASISRLKPVFGSGYPHGFRGDEIPLLARIVHVTDAFDAMTSARAYRPGRSTAEALRELWRCAGAEFDAEVVQALAGALPSIELSSAIDPRPGSVRLTLVTSSSGS